ncbi:MAG: GTPase HflX [Ignisphaera sp.]
MLEPALLVVKVDDIGNLEEALAIAREAGFDVKDIVYVKSTSTKCYLSPGILEKIKNIISSNGVKKICIYDELKPRHVACLVKELNVEVVDKVVMILNVFQQHAGSREALLQIEIARLKHQLPLIRDWIRRAKLRELPGFLSLGRYAIDIYYKHMTKRIARLSEELEKLRDRRLKERETRRGQGFIHVAIVGYTNAGKTTLFNALTNLNKPTGTEMFTTLSPKSYLVKVCGYNIVVVDTIGFIKNIPIGIIEAFKAVLEEISMADAIALIVDGSKELDQLRVELETALKILRDVGCETKPIVLALNKVDLISSGLEERIELINHMVKEYNLMLVDVVPISALKKLNIDSFKEALCRTAELIQKNLTLMFTY